MSVPGDRYQYVVVATLFHVHRCVQYVLPALTLPRFKEAHHHTANIYHHYRIWCCRGCCHVALSVLQVSAEEVRQVFDEARYLLCELARLFEMRADLLYKPCRYTTRSIIIDMPLPSDDEQRCCTNRTYYKAHQKPVITVTVVVELHVPLGYPGFEDACELFSLNPTTVLRLAHRQDCWGITSYIYIYIRNNCTTTYCSFLLPTVTAELVVVVYEGIAEVLEYFCTIITLRLHTALEGGPCQFTNHAVVGIGHRPCWRKENRTDQ